MYAVVHIVITVALVVLPAAVLIRDWRFKDRRTKRHHQITRGLLIAWGLTALGTVGLTWYESIQSSRMAAQVDELVEGKNQLLAQIQQYERDLQVEKEKVRKLDLDAKRAKRGITGTYDFRGNYRSTSPGSISGVMGARAEVFDRIIELHNSQNWRELSDLCEKEIKATPEWLTPYLFAGVAQVNLGNKARALELLEHVQTNAAGDPEYAEVDGLLDRLRSK